MKRRARSVAFAVRLSNRPHTRPASDERGGHSSLRQCAEPDRILVEGQRLAALLSPPGGRFGQAGKAIILVNF